MTMTEKVITGFLFDRKELSLFKTLIAEDSPADEAFELIVGDSLKYRLIGSAIVFCIIVLVSGGTALVFYLILVYLFSWVKWLLIGPESDGFDGGDN